MCGSTLLQPVCRRTLPLAGNTVMSSHNNTKMLMQKGWHAGHKDSLVPGHSARQLIKGPPGHQGPQLPEVQGPPHLVALVGIQPLGLLPQQRAAAGTPPEGWHCGSGGPVCACSGRPGKHALPQLVSLALL